MTQTIAKQQAGRLKRDIVSWLEELRRAVSEDYDNLPVLYRNINQNYSISLCFDTKLELDAEGMTECKGRS